MFREAISQGWVHVGSAEIRTLIFLQIRISGLGYMQYFPEGVNPHTVSTNPCSNPLSRNPQLGGDARRQCPSHILSNLQLTFYDFHYYRDRGNEKLFSVGIKNIKKKVNKEKKKHENEKKKINK